MKLLHPTLLLFAACGIALGANEMTDLFNGKDIDGWVKRGGKAEYKVEEGVIVGTSMVGTPNTFLCTPREYADFVLEYEFKVDPRLNSGVQIRSKQSPTETKLSWEGKEITVGANVVHGYQIEIDPDQKKDRWWTAGLYDEARRGWLFPGSIGGDPKAFSEQGRKIFKQNEWNHIRIEAIGDSLKTFLNGELRVSAKDGFSASGFIGLQVHDINGQDDKAGAQVRWRNIRIQESNDAHNKLTEEEATNGWKLLWDGKTNEGWRSAKGAEFPKGGWTTDGGTLTIHETGGGESSSAGDIITREKYSDFELSVDFKITPGANSGIKLFVDPELNKGEGSSIGVEFQILDDVLHPDAKLGREGNRTIGSVYDMITAPATKRVNPVGEWNNARILSEGKNVTYWLNGVQTAKFERGSKEWRDTVAISKYKVWPSFGELPTGHILLQDHGNEVFFRNIKIRDFSNK